MKNWSGTVHWNPKEIAYPTTEAEVQQIVLRAANNRQKVRVIGTGHSFTALCQTDDILISLDNYQGLISVNKDLEQATVKAGTKLNYLGELLFKEGLAMENLGDIDVQSIAGTISTGTHGTGAQFGTISTQVCGLRFVNGKGEIVDCSPTNNPELFKAAQVSMGLLGVITEVTLQCVPAYKLHLEVCGEDMHHVLDTLDQNLQDNRNFEFYWFPYTEKVASKRTNLVEKDEVDKVTFFNYWTEYVMENYAFKLVCEFARLFPARSQAVSRFTADLISKTTKILHSHKVYATPRLVKFREMEYNVPAEAYQEVWKDVVRTFERRKFPIHFPLENRWVKGDDLLMSPAYGRDSAYIACHVYKDKDHRPYFTAMEEIFRNYGGRPHWGKMNTLTGVDVATMYPEFPTFLKHRAEQDPDNLFLTPYLHQLLGIETKAKVLV
ncbi:MAG: D-arabinono-1,4-lactone oxidase [Bacteroidota bacterium]